MFSKQLVMIKLRVAKNTPTYQNERRFVFVSAINYQLLLVPGSGTGVAMRHSGHIGKMQKQEKNMGFCLSS